LLLSLRFGEYKFVAQATTAFGSPQPHHLYIISKGERLRLPLLCEGAAASAVSLLTLCSASLALCVFVLLSTQLAPMPRKGSGAFAAFSLPERGLVARLAIDTTAESARASPTFALAHTRVQRTTRATQPPIALVPPVARCAPALAPAVTPTQAYPGMAHARYYLSLLLLFCADIFDSHYFYFSVSTLTNRDAR
jgi:hypothetical protein